MKVWAQYVVVGTRGLGGITEWRPGDGIVRNITSSGINWWGWCARHRRLNIWPFSIWF